MGWRGIVAICGLLFVVWDLDPGLLAVLLTVTVVGVLWVAGRRKRT